MDFILENSPFKFYKLELPNLNNITQIGSKKYVSGNLIILREKGNKEAKLLNLKFELLEQNKKMVKVKSIFSKSQLNLLFLLDTNEKITLRKALQVYGLWDSITISQSPSGLSSYVLIPIKTKKGHSLEEIANLGKEFLELNKSIFNLETGISQTIGDVLYAKLLVEFEEISNPAIQDAITLSVLEDTLVNIEEDYSKVEKFGDIEVIYKDDSKEIAISEAELIREYKGFYFEDNFFSNANHSGEDLLFFVHLNDLFNVLKVDEKTGFWNGAFAGIRLHKDGLKSDVYIHNFLLDDHKENVTYFNKNVIAVIKNVLMKKQVYVDENTLNNEYSRTVYKLEWETGQVDWLEKYLGRHHYSEKGKNIKIFEQFVNNFLSYYKDWVVGIEVGDDYGEEGKELILKAHIADEKGFIADPIAVELINCNKFSGDSVSKNNQKNKDSNSDNYACKDVYYPSSQGLSLCEKCGCNRSIHSYEYKNGKIVKI